MTFKELEVRLINELSLMTVDDFGVYQNQLIEDYLQGVDKAEYYVCESGVKLTFKFLLKTKLKLQKDLEEEKKETSSSLMSLESKNNLLKRELAGKNAEKKELLLKDMNLHKDITIDDLRRKQQIEWNSNFLLRCESDINKLQKESKELKKQIKNASKNFELLDSKLNIIKIELDDLNLSHEKIDDEYSALEFIAKVLLRKELQFNYFDYIFLNEINEPIYSQLLINYLKKSVFEIPIDWKEQLVSVFSSIPNLSGNVRYYYLYNSENVLAHRTIRNLANYNETDYSIILSLLNGLNTCISVVSNNKCIYIALSGGILAKISFAEITEKVQNFKTKEIELFCFESRESGVKFNTQKQFNLWGLNLDLPIGYYILTDKYIINISFSTSPILISNNLSTTQIISLQNTIERQKRESLDDDDDD